MGGWVSVRTQGDLHLEADSVLLLLPLLSTHKTRKQIHEVKKDDYKPKKDDKYDDEDKY
jgi:hypothetical protein